MRSRYALFWSFRVVSLARAAEFLFWRPSFLGKVQAFSQTKEGNPRESDGGATRRRCEPSGALSPYRTGLLSFPPSGSKQRSFSVRPKKVPSLDWRSWGLSLPWWRPWRSCSAVSQDGRILRHDEGYDEGFPRRSEEVSRTELEEILSSLHGGDRVAPCRSSATREVASISSSPVWLFWSGLAWVRVLWPEGGPRRVQVGRVSLERPMPSSRLIYSSASSCSTREWLLRAALSTAAPKLSGTSAPS